MVYPRTYEKEEGMNRRANHIDNVEVVKLSEKVVESVLEGTSNYTVAIRVTAYSLSSSVQVGLEESIESSPILS